MNRRKFLTGLIGGTAGLATLLVPFIEEPTDEEPPEWHHLTVRSGNVPGTQIHIDGRTILSTSTPMHGNTTLSVWFTHPDVEERKWRSGDPLL